MAVGNNLFPNMPVISGCRLTACAAGVRYKNRPDLVLMEFCPEAITAGCFTQNAFQAAPVIVAKKNLTSAKPRYFLINSGNANACTGQQGLEDANASCQFVAESSHVDPEQVIPFSTGVIGERLNIEAIRDGLPKCFSDLSEKGWKQAAEGMTTTDTFPKGVTKTVFIDGTPIVINGIAKGAGMIRPDMATMLSYVVTDAVVSQETLQQLCSIAVNKSFNRITVDGDTSTNDAAMLVATRQADNNRIDSLDSPAGKLFADAVIEVFEQLAQLLVRDGEGATKFVTVRVLGAASESDALAVAYAVAESPLVKTALFASDPNWGRLVMAIGKSGVADLDQNKIRLWLGDQLVVEQGQVAQDYTEQKGQQVLNQEEILVAVDLAMGDHTESVWACDFSHEYVSINADYRS